MMAMPPTGNKVSRRNSCFKKWINHVNWPPLIYGEHPMLALPHTRSGLFIGLICAAMVCQADALNLGARGRLALLQENEHPGQAASLALRLNWQRTWLENLSSQLQLDAVGTGWQQHYSDGVRFNGQPRMPDVPGVDVQQAYINYQTNRAHIKVGRQNLEWDNQRFLSSNGFWQNPQSFDALSVVYHLAEESQWQYAYINTVARIFGAEAGTFLNPKDVNYTAQNGLRPKDALGIHQMHSHALQLQWREWDYSELTAYGYFINNETLPAFSNHTLGVRYGYQHKFGAWNYRHAIAVARQKRPELSNQFDLPYWHIQNSLGLGATEWALDIERLGSSKGKAFITPLGFSHEYQGWADRFVATPRLGVDDISLRNTTRFNKNRLDFRYHEFYAVAGGDFYGREYDAEFSRQLASQHKIALRYARFNAADVYKTQFKNVSSVFFTWAYHY